MDLSTCALEKRVNTHCAARPGLGHKKVYLFSGKVKERMLNFPRPLTSTGPAHLASPEDTGAALQAPSALCPRHPLPSVPALHTRGLSGGVPVPPKPGMCRRTEL